MLSASKKARAASLGVVLMPWQTIEQGAALRLRLGSGSFMLDVDKLTDVQRFVLELPADAHGLRELRLRQANEAPERGNVISTRPT